MNTPTPETDELVSKVPAGTVPALWNYDHAILLCKKLERERDEANKNSFTSLGYGNLIKERDQLRKVCDELAKLLQVGAQSQHMIDAIAAYNSLPHVKAKGTK